MLAADMGLTNGWLPKEDNMVNPEKDYIKLDERNHVEKPLFDQLTGKVRVTPLLTELQEAGNDFQTPHQSRGPPATAKG